MEGGVGVGGLIYFSIFIFREKNFVTSTPYLVSLLLLQLLTWYRERNAELALA